MKSENLDTDMIIGEALDLAPESRDSFIADACAGNEGRRQRAAEAVARVGFLDSPPVQIAEDDEERLTVGESVGAYRILREIGRGGMGAVYLAERSDGQFEGQVAIKVIASRYRTERLLSRFRTEREILGRLDHRWIARLYDSGTLPDGRPYLIMGYVDGKPLTQFCDGKTLSIESRLRIFERVCGAVSFAHGKLVAHGDLKPSNILVATDGDPRLVDFGVATELDRVVQGGQSQLASGRARVTLAYTSPERLDGRRASVEADVFSLGVILHELLSGKLPIDVRGCTRREALKRLRERLPVKASSAFVPELGHASEMRTGQRAATAQQRAQDRGTTPTRLRRLINGDLDAIVAKALQPDFSRRYATVAELSSDIRRYVNRMPVAARGSSRHYRLARYVRRNSLYVSLAVIGTLTLVIYTASLRSAQQKASHERDRATEVSDFLFTIFKAASPEVSLGEEISAVELVEQAYLTLRTESSMLESRTEASLLLTLGTVYRLLGRYDRSLELLSESLEIQQGEDGSLQGDDVAILVEISKTSTLAANYPQALTRIEAAIAILKAEATRDTQLAEALVLLGDICREQGNYERARAAYNEGAELSAGHDIEIQAHHLANAFNGLATLEQETGELAVAEDFFLRALALRERALHRLHPLVTSLLNNLGLLYTRQERFDEAESILKDVIEREAEAYPDKSHPARITATGNLALLFSALERYDEAEAIREENIELLRARLGDSHISVAKGLHGLAYAYNKQERWREAVPLLEEAIAIKRKTLAPDHYSLAISLNSLASAFDDLGRFAEAEAVNREAAGIFNETLGRNHDYSIAAEHNYAHILQAQGRTEEALAVEQALLERVGSLEGAPTSNYARILSAVGRLLGRLGRHEEAVLHLRQAVEVLRSTLPTAHPRYGRELERYEAALRSAGRDGEADEVERERLALLSDAATQ